MAVPRDYARSRAAAAMAPVARRVCLCNETRSGDPRPRPRLVSSRLVSSRLKKLSIVEPDGRGGRSSGGKCRCIHAMTDAPPNASADEPEANPSLIGEIEQIVGEQLDELEDLVREHPVASFGIAAAAGLMLALVLTRR